MRSGNITDTAIPLIRNIQSQPHGQGIGWHKPIVITVLMRRRGIINARWFIHPILGNYFQLVPSAVSRPSLFKRG